MFSEIILTIHPSQLPHAAATYVGDTPHCCLQGLIRFDGFQQGFLIWRDKIIIHVRI